MTSLPSLIAKLESASGPSRELDTLIYDAVGRPGDDDPQYFASLHGDCPPAYTRSIDAAMSLVPGNGDVVLVQCDGEYEARIGNRATREQYIAGGPSFALALCIAALKARARSQEPGTYRASSILARSSGRPSPRPAVEPTHAAGREIT